MSMKNVCVLLALVLPILLLQGRANAATGASTSYSGFQVLFPTGDAADAYDTGWGITGSSRFSRSEKFDIVFEGAYYYLPGKNYIFNGETIAQENMNGLSFLLGGLFDLGTLELGAKGGYYFLDLHEWDLVPMAQLSFGRFSIGGEYKALGTTNWGAAFLKFRW